MNKEAPAPVEEVIETLKGYDKAYIEKAMEHWDSWRGYIAEGGRGSLPRDGFESYLYGWQEDAQAALSLLEQQQREIQRLTQQEGEKDGPKDSASSSHRRCDTSGTVDCSLEETDDPRVADVINREIDCELVEHALSWAHGKTATMPMTWDRQRLLLCDLASALTRLIDERDDFQRRLAYTQKCNKTLRACIRGEFDPVELQSQLAAAKDENERYRKALEKAREYVANTHAVLASASGVDDNLVKPDLDMIDDALKQPAGD